MSKAYRVTIVLTMYEENGIPEAADMQNIEDALENSDVLRPGESLVSLAVDRAPDLDEDDDDERDDEPTTTCRKCGEDFPDSSMIPADDDEGGEYCVGCAPEPKE